MTVASLEMSDEPIFLGFELFVVEIVSNDRVKIRIKSRKTPLFWKKYFHFSDYEKMVTNLDARIPST